MGSARERTLASHTLDTAQPVRDRSAKDIIQSAMEYCQWRASHGRRGLLSAAQRFDPDRVWYLNGFATLRDHLYKPEEPKGLHVALPVLHPAPSIDPRAAKLCDKPRAWLVEELLSANPKLSNRKLLLHLGKLKLATMLVDAMDANDALKKQEQRLA
jgi:hypothetical protein